MKPSPSGRHQTPVVSMRRGKPASRSRAGEAEHRAALGRHRNLDAGERRQRAPAGAGAIRRPRRRRSCVPSAKRAAVTRPPSRSRPMTSPGPVFGAERAGLAAVGLQQAPAVEPAFAGAAPGAAGEVLRVEPGEAAGERCLLQQRDVGALEALQGMIFFEHRGAGSAREIEVAAFPQRDVRPLAVDREALPDPAQERDAEQRDADVHGARELLPDRGGRERRGRAPIGRVLLDDEDPAAKARIGEEVIGDGRSHRRPADDDHVVGVGHGCSGQCLSAAMSRVSRGAAFPLRRSDGFRNLGATSGATLLHLHPPAPVNPSSQRGLVNAAFMPKHAPHAL